MNIEPPTQGYLSTQTLSEIAERCPVGSVIASSHAAEQSDESPLVEDTLWQRWFS